VRLASGPTACLPYGLEMAGKRPVGSWPHRDAPHRWPALVTKELDRKISIREISLSSKEAKFF
jgi:hypothetical protein